MLISFETFDRQAFFQRVASSSQRLLLLDYDGTLAPFRVQRDRCWPYDGVRELLDAIIAANHTRVVIITGRAIQDIVPLLGLKLRPDIWGTHGWEQLDTQGNYTLAAVPPSTQIALEQARQALEGVVPADRIEQKPVSIAVHWRGLSSAATEQMRVQVGAVWSPLSHNSSLAIHSFDGGLELRVQGRDKGFVVRNILQTLHGDVQAAYLGDDLTDEDAFAAICDVGLGVLVRDEPRATRATLWLRPPAELLAFLTLWHEAAQLSRLR